MGCKSPLSYLLERTCTSYLWVSNRQEKVSNVGFPPKGRVVSMAMFQARNLLNEAQRTILNNINLFKRYKKVLELDFKVVLNGHISAPRRSNYMKLTPRTLLSTFQGPDFHLWYERSTIRPIMNRDAKVTNI